MSAQADAYTNYTPTNHHGKGQLVCPSLRFIPRGPSWAAGIEAVDIGTAHGFGQRTGTLTRIQRQGIYHIKCSPMCLQIRMEVSSYRMELFNGSIQNGFRGWFAYATKRHTPHQFYL